MKPDAGTKTSQEKPREIPRFFRSRQRSSRDLPLVRWAAWAVIVALIALAIFVIWGLATHEPSQSPFRGD